MAAQKIHASTQKFIEVQDIRDDIVLLAGNTACLVIEAQASNFALLSQEEQNARVYSYASLLNSLSFSVQILIRNKRLDISQYVKLLENEIAKTQNEKLKTYMQLYKEFVKELVKVNTVLDKKFYLIIPYSPLEKGPANALPQTKGKDASFESAKTVLHTKADSLHGQLARLNLRAKTLQKDELIKLFYTIYNDDALETGEIDADIKAPMVTTQQ